MRATENWVKKKKMKPVRGRALNVIVYRNILQNKKNYNF